MKTVSDLLRDADPVRREPPVPRSDRERVRRAVVSAALDRAPAGARRLVPSLIAAVLAAAIVGTAAAGWKVWLGGSTPLQAAVRFEARLAETTPASGLREARIAGSDTIIYLHPEPVVTNGDIAAARVVERQDGRGFEIAVTFNASGGQKMREATSGHMGEPMAILIDDDVVAAPTIRSPIGAEARITGTYTKAQAERIANGMLIR